MKRFLIGSAGVLAVTAVGVYLFRGAIFDALEGPITANMFISADTDRFDPGLPIGTRFPPIRALYQGQVITEIDQFVRDRGALFIANRSVDW